MSKKRFTEGLESLFSGPGHENPPDERNAGRRETAADKDREKGKRPSSGKDFSSDLQSFLQEAFEESLEEQLSRKRQGAEPESGGRRRRGALSGLDALIRDTLEPASMEIDPEAKRRLVVIFREAQLQKLKTIARLEQTYLKEIINGIVEEFIEEYEKKKGRIE